MANKTRGRERLLNCDSCGRRIPRDKALRYDNVTVYSTDMKNMGEGAQDVRTMLRREQHFCPSCGKHRRLYQKKGRQMARRAERGTGPGGRGESWGDQDRWGRQERF